MFKILPVFLDLISLLNIWFAGNSACLLIMQDTYKFSKTSLAVLSELIFCLRCLEMLRNFSRSKFTIRKKSSGRKIKVNAWLGKISLNFPEFLLFEGGSERNAMENKEKKKNNSTKVLF